MATIIERQGKKGVSYRIQVRVKNRGQNTYETKTTTWKPESGLSKTAIKKQLVKFVSEYENKIRGEYEIGLASKKNLTVNEYSEIWLESIKQNRSPSYYASAKHILKDIRNHLGGYKLKELSPIIIQKYIDNMQKCNIESIKVVDKDFSKLIKERKYSKEKLSRMSGVCTSTILKITRGGAVEYENALKLAKAMNEDIESLFTVESGSKRYDNATLAKRCRVLRSMLSVALKQQYIEKNYATSAYVDNVKEVRKEKVFLDDVEIKNLLLKLKNYNNIRAKAAITTLIFTGLRRGELVGLEWKDIDFDAKTMTIKRSCVVVTGFGMVTGKTKTLSSNRTITLPQVLIEELKEYKGWWDRFIYLLGDRYGGSNRLFLQEDGTPMYPSTVRYWFKKMLQDFNIKDVNLHSLRHSNITIQLAAGVPLKTVSVRAGHSSTKVTSEIYAHMIKSSDQDAADRLDSILG